MRIAWQNRVDKWSIRICGMHPARNFVAGRGQRQGLWLFAKFIRFKFDLNTVSNRLEYTILDAFTWSLHAVLIVVFLFLWFSNIFRIIYRSTLT